MEIRSATPAELTLLRDIERAAGVMFTLVGLDEVASHEPESIESLTEYLDDGRLWVAPADSAPAGYALVDLVDGAAHLEQLSVLPDHGRRALGSALIEHVCEWARASQLPGVTLTTFSDVPWNRPLYERRGFHVLDECEVGPELRALRDREAAHGLDPALRVCMRRDLDR